MNKLSLIKALLMKELKEEDLSKKQMDIADEAEPFDKITGADFKALQAKKKKGIKELKDSNLTIGSEIIGSKKHFFLYDPKTGKKWGLFDSKEEAEKALNSKNRILSKENTNKHHIDKKLVKEGEDHEVSMAHNSLESIIKSAMELKSKLGDMERNIPGWIQDHITNAENYIDQAAQGFHELEHHEEEPEEEETMDLQSMMGDLFEIKKRK